MFSIGTGLAPGLQAMAEYVKGNELILFRFFVYVFLQMSLMIISFLMWKIMHLNLPLSKPYFSPFYTKKSLLNLILYV